MKSPKQIPPQSVVDGDHVLSAGKDEIIRRVLSNCAFRAERSGCPMWVCVQDVTAYGSTYSQQLCRAYGFNPDYRV